MEAAPASASGKPAKLVIPELSLTSSKTLLPRLMNSWLEDVRKV